MYKWLILILLLSCTIQLCSINSAIYKISPMQGIAHAADLEQWWQLEEIQKVTPKVTPKVISPSYTIQDGDTLGSIATIYNMDWQTLWEINKDTIKNPHLIYIGQKIRVTAKYPELPPLTKEEKINKLAKLMFKASGLRYEEKSAIESCMKEHQESLLASSFLYMDNQRFLMMRYHELTRQYEIWTLSEAIVDLAPDDDTLYKLVGLAWQESHFVNRMGNRGEIGFFQFLPSTVKEHLRLDNIGLLNALWELKNDSRAAVSLTLILMQEYKWNWALWNHGENYGRHVNNKVHMVKSEFMRR